MEVGSIKELLVWLLVIGGAFTIFFYAPLPAPVKTVANVILAILAVLLLFQIPGLVK